MAAIWILNSLYQIIHARCFICLLGFIYLFIYLAFWGGFFGLFIFFFLAHMFALWNKGSIVDEVYPEVLQVIWVSFSMSLEIQK